MASVMGICGGFGRPKSGNVEKVWVFKAFLMGQGSEEDSRKRATLREWLDLGRFDVETVRLLIKTALCLYLKLCFLCRRGAQFQKNNEKSGRKVKNGAGRR